MIDRLGGIEVEAGGYLERRKQIIVLGIDGDLERRAAGFERLTTVEKIEEGESGLVIFW